MANGYWQLRDALVVVLLGVPVAVAVRFVEVFLMAPPRGYAAGPPTFSLFGSSVLLLTVGIAFAKSIAGALALAKKPSEDHKKGLQIGLCVFACFPGLNLIVFPPLLSLFTLTVGTELGKRSIRRAGWILAVCSLVLVAPVVFAIRAGLDDASDGPPTPTRSSTPEPLPAELLMGGGIAVILFVAAYIVTIMTLTGVARAVERSLIVEPSNDPAVHFDQLKDVLRPTESLSNKLCPVAYRA